MSLGWRIGQFLIFIGLISLVIFFASLQDLRAALVFCCAGWVLLVLGGIAMWVNRNPAPPAERFSLLHRLRGRGKKKG